MLKDITLGQYFPGNSPIHRMDPRTKLLALILYIVTIFIADGLIPYIICAAGLVAADCQKKDNNFCQIHKKTLAKS